MRSMRMSISEDVEDTTYSEICSKGAFELFTEHS